MISEYETEVDGWSATWQLHQRQLRITLVGRKAGDSTPLVSCALVDAPDLAQLRERYPNLARLWDGIRADFWSPTRTGVGSHSATATYEGRVR